MIPPNPADRPADIPVVILCGGEGTRLREATERLPKPLVEIGGEPILLHIMRIYARQGFRRFILCLGYKGSLIKEAFLDYELRRRDLEIDLASGERRFLGAEPDMDWRITLAETGDKTQTGGRVARIARYVEGERFMLTYGDGLSDIDLAALLAHHRRSGMVGTVTGVRPSSQFGQLATEGDRVAAFAEKPTTETLINGGFFVFERAMFDYLSDRTDCVLEREPLERLSADGRLGVYRHRGFWRCMDTFKDYTELNRMHRDGERPWIRPGGAR